MPTPTDPAKVIRAQVMLEEHDMARDGRFAVVVRRFVHRDRYRSHLWLVPLDGRGRPIQLTDGPVRDGWPRIAPDGRRIAFKRTPAATTGHARRGPAEDPADHAAHVRVLEISEAGAAVGRAWALRTPRDRPVGELAWSPDGQRLAFTMDVDPPRFIRGEAAVGDDTPTVRVLRRIDWRWDEAGHLDRWAHVHLVDARRGARPRQVTSGDWGASKLAWSPDGSRIAFVADPRPGADVAPAPSVWTVAVSGDAPAGEAPAEDGVPPIEVLRLAGGADKPAWSPDGRWLVAQGYIPENPTDDQGPEVVIGPADGSSPPWPIAPTLDRPPGAWNDTDLHAYTVDSRTTACWVDAGTIVITITDRGQAMPFRIDVDPASGRPVGRARPLTASRLTAYSLAGTAQPGVPRDRRVTALAAVDGRPMELVTLPLDGSQTAGTRAAAPRRRTTMGSRWARGFAWPRMDLLEVPGPGGTIEMWVASPEGAGPGALPTIVDIHGGPLGCWGAVPSLQHVLLAARGYRVLLPNIRGSTGYGSAWITPQLGDWGGVDAADVHAAVDHAVAAGLADPDRLGVLGWSYGGFMVHWLLGTSDRFRAGVSEAGVANQVSAWTESDSGVEFNRASKLGSPLDEDGVARLWRQSPLAHVAAIRAPLLILQGEADQRCPVSDNAQLFTALRVLGRTVEMALYPEESHSYHAAGRPDRRIDRMTRMLDWFDRHVKG